jgi:hypothetical protein
VSALILLAVALTGCAFSFFGYERRAPWRDAEEKSCMRQHLVVLSAYTQPEPRLNGGGACGMADPLKVSAFQQGTVALGPSTLMNCPMTTSVDGWLTEAVQPAALAWFGEPIVGVTDFGSYSCRPVDDIRGNQLSEHSFGNAIDISGFRLMDGTLISVKRDWYAGGDAARGFLREVFAAACERFKTALGPGARYHNDHFHLDLAHHGQDGISRYCNPRPDGPAPVRAPYSAIMASNQRPQPYDWRPTGSIRPASGPLLADAPADVIATEINDPFGVAAMQQKAPGAN